MKQPIDKIDTQGMSGPIDPNYKGKKKKPSSKKPMMVKPQRYFTPLVVNELKHLINEVLDEREGKMDYQSYFDLEGREYPVK
mgnify:CR=1 FL=1|tara:strand:+ start:200 stop:445 length:246 start_codon:yes stop_codon:yes gene_type:complete